MNYSAVRSRPRPRLLPGLALLTIAVSVSAALPRAAQSRQANNPVAATEAKDRMQGYATRQELIESSVVRKLPFRNVGPAVMSGRVTDIDASPHDPTHFYVAYASGGLWYTDNNGTTFTPLFDDQASMTIGDIAVDWEHGGTIWVGTGENNSSRSSYAGTGIYRSDDGGQTWEHRGLAGTQRTGRIILHPTDPNTIWVAAAGNLYSPSRDRGVYLSTDGGRNWEKTLFVDDRTGVIDLVIDPSNPDVLFAATWHRERRAWDFVESGPGSGIYRSEDGGRTWRLVSTAQSGLPTGDGVGRIGLAVYPADPSIMYALVDNQNRRPPEEEEEDVVLTRDELRGMDSATFLALPDSVIAGYLEENGFPDRYDVKEVRRLVQAGTIAPVALVEYVEDANQQLFDTPVIGAEVYRSDDSGATWRRTHEEFLDSVYNSYGYYFGEIRVSPFDPDRIYVLGVPLIASSDGGATFESLGAPNVHVDHQAFWVSDSREGHLIDGNDGGLNISFDDGESWTKANVPPVGQFYTVQVDDARPYNVYGGLQDNGVWFGPSTYEASTGWHSSGHYAYRSIIGGDGMQVEVDTRDNETVYTGSQFGFYGRQNTRTGERASTRPRHELGERPLRFNWQTPIHLSRHNQDIFYIGANRLYRSLNRGENLQPISGDLTKGGRMGDVPYGTLTTIDESPMRFGLLYVGSDDGLIHVSRDGGVSWNRISDRLPQDLWVSRVEASAHDEGRVYVSLNGYRWDNFEAHVYVSDNFGASWRRIGTDLPSEPVNVVLEDPAVESIVYVGTDHGLYVSMDGGATFQAMHGGMPAAPVHDLKIQQRENDLVVGTHGRSIFIADLEHLHAIVNLGLRDSVYVFDPRVVTVSSRWGSRSAAWTNFFEPESEMAFFVPSAGTVALQIRNEDGATVAEREVEAVRGLNYYEYDLAVDNPPIGEDGDPVEAADNGKWYLDAGEYDVVVVAGSDSGTAKLRIREQGGR